MVIMCFLLLLLHVLHFVNGIVIDASNYEGSTEISDYYWRDYNGIVPNDAVPGGVDRSGNFTYIGQIPFEGPRLLPATIYRGHNDAHSTIYKRTVGEDKNVKILCSRNQHRYSWIPVKYENLHLLTDCHLVIGGMEKEYTLYIGRAFYDRKTRIGKVYDISSPYDGLAVPYKRKEIRFMTFEVLAYNCTLNYFCNNIV